MDDGFGEAFGLMVVMLAAMVTGLAIYVVGWNVWQWVK